MPKTKWNPMHAMPGKREYEAYHVINDDHLGMPGFHSHHFFEFFIYVAGNVDVVIEGQRFTPEPYTLFIYPPGVMHRWMPPHTAQRYERAYAYITREYIERLSLPEFPMAMLLDDAAAEQQYCYPLGYKTGAAIVALLDEIAQTNQLPDVADQLLNRCRIDMLLISICRLLVPGTNAAESPPTRIREIINYINEHITEPLSLDMLMEKFFVSKYYLLHSFKEYANMSVHQYVISKRIGYAQNLMHEGMSPGDAAIASGFSDYAGFYRAFVKRIGVTPQAFCRGQSHKFFHSDDHES